MKNIYLKPSTNVNEAVIKSSVLVHSYDYADSKSRGFYDEEEKIDNNNHSDWSTDYWK